MSALSPRTRGSRNVIRLFVAAVAIGAITWLQMVELPNPDMDEAEAAPTAPTRARARPAPDTARVKINPGLFRGDIVFLEKALYKPNAVFDDGWMVEVRAKNLAESLLKYREDRHRSRAGIAVSRFGAMVGGEMDAPYGRGKDRWPEWRKQWQSLRGAYFLDADWFTTHDPRGIPLTSSGGPVSPADRAAARALSDFAADLQAGIRRGRDEALKIPDPPGAAFVNTAEGQRLTKQWRDWAARWIGRIDSLARAYDAGAPASDQNLVRARQQLDSALTALRQFAALSGDRGFPLKTVRRERLEAALKQVDGARDYLSRVGTP